MPINTQHSMCNMLSPPTTAIGLIKPVFIDCAIAPRNPAKFRIYNFLHPSIPPHIN